MRTGYSPAIQWLAPSLTCIALLGCSPSEKPALTRDVEVSISVSWPDSPQQRAANVEVGAMRLEKAKEPIAIAIIRRNSTVNEAWKEKQKRAAEIEKLQTEFEAMGLASVPPSPSSPTGELRKEVDACREMLNNLADTAVLYLDDVKQKLGADFDKERVERFRKNLGAEELRDLAIAVKDENTPQVRKALGDAREILGREVWGGRAGEKERAMRIISELEKMLASAAPARPATRAVPKGAEDMKGRIIAVVKDQAAWDDRLTMANRPLVMYTALGTPEVRAKTDSDGKCHLILPREGRWVLTAYVDRPPKPGLSEKAQSLMIGEKEEMVWIIEAPGIGSERASIMLTESNALHPGVAPLKMDSKGE